MAGYRAVLDACVLVPVLKADVLLELGSTPLYEPLWSTEILKETLAAVKLIHGKDITARVDAMNEAFPDALITGMEKVRDGLTGLPDPGDAHVLAAAIVGRASVIVTDNVRDFPESLLGGYGLQAKSSEEFWLDMLDLDPALVVARMERASARRKSPPVDYEEFLLFLAALLPDFSSLLRKLR